MTTANRLPVPAPTVIDGEVVTRTSNPHTVPTAITGVGLLAALIAFGYAAHTQPAHLNVSAAAVLAAILVFLFNLGRHHAYEERHR